MPACSTGVADAEHEIVKPDPAVPHPFDLRHRARQHLVEVEPLDDLPVGARRKQELDALDDLGVHRKPAVA